MAEFPLLLLHLPVKSAEIVEEGFSQTDRFPVQAVLFLFHILELVFYLLMYSADAAAQDPVTLLIADAVTEYIAPVHEDFGILFVPDSFGGCQHDCHHGDCSAASEDLEALEKDPAAVLYGAILGKLMARSMAVRGEREPLAAATKAFAAGLMEWQKGKPSYPDANSTMRLTWGHVGGYSPKDGVQYSYFTTLKGVFEKEDPTNPEFIVPADVKAAWTAKNFGRYLDADGTLHTCFLSNNDITGGNSGSPIMNARGELIGLAFDGNWESMSSDVMFEPALQRCINVDIRYVLWMVDTVGGAGHLVREMDLVN